jgi:type I restriction enzyme S subunit
MRDDWIETTFETFASLEKGISYKSSELCDEGEGLPFINLKSIDRGGGYRPDGLKWYSGKFKSSQVVEPGDLILCCTDLTKQKAILGFPILVPNIGHSRFCISLDLAKIIVDEELILKSFLFLLLQDRRMREFMQSRSSGTTVMHLKTSEVPDVRVALPPLPEQKRIVDLISSVDSYIEALQQQLESAKRSRNAVLHELLTVDGDDWVESSLGVQMSLEYGKPLTESNRDGIGFPVYGSAGIVGMHSEPLVSTAPVIIVGRKGTAGAVYWSEEQCFVIDTAYFVALKTDIELKFLYHLLNFVDLKSVTAQTGVPGLNRDRAYSLKCKIPPKSKQFEIVEMISTMDEVVNKTESILAETQNLRSGLLSDLLSGEHEIPASYDKVIGAA